MSDKKVALVTGITGQDGSYLTELLLEKGYEVSRMNAVTLQQLTHRRHGGVTKRMHDFEDLKFPQGSFHFDAPLLLVSPSSSTPTCLFFAASFCGRAAEGLVRRIGSTWQGHCPNRPSSHLYWTRISYQNHPLC